MIYPLSFQVVDFENCSLRFATASVEQVGLFESYFTFIQPYVGNQFSLL